MAEEQSPKVNLMRQKTQNELTPPAIKELIPKPKVPRASIHFLFHFLDYELMKMLEVE